ncbi:tetratricopeptide repeat protein [Flavobacterium subsaxonicum]|uniref:Tetratricopeptide repeat protein n=1 Tax=Flavobacterium subsaxonicum WB 4.1-42 = DSM 21790 TaxID=1121898 RepID=A0A0A2MIY8_9FLAO|nr:tetratricopeptide repeat protein [Flavobacterium subsaxonicum]KGO92587.1 hypothetical protein Q766_12495 [Flavobacterium subsaxonicum WB 4.1-42 = DSM 21790]
MKKYLLLLLALFTILNASAQAKYKFRGSYTKKQFLSHADSLFYFNGDISYNITSSLVKPYKDIVPDKSLAPGYLEGLMAQLAKDSTNSHNYGNIATYYQQNGEGAKAVEYYNKALKKLTLSPKDKDSAGYYSYRGLLKINVGEDGAKDMERALKINKTDSLAVVFYPLFLIGNQRFADARTMLTNVLIEKKYVHYSYLMLMLNDFSEKLSKLGTYGDLASDLKKIDIGTIVNMDAYDKYIDKKDPVLVNIKQFSGVSSCLIKFGGALGDSKFTVNDKDIAFIQEREKTILKMLKDKNANKYAVYSALGTLSFLQKKYAEATDYYDKALVEFPADKEGHEFNTLETYDNLASVYYLQKKYDKAIEVLAKKLSVKTLGVEGAQKTYTSIAQIYLQAGNTDAATDNARLAMEKGESFDVNFLLSHIYLKSNSLVQADRYRSKSESYLVTEADLCNLVTYSSILYLSLYQPDGAREIYEKNKALFVNEGCTDCLKLLEKYTLLNK